MSEPKLYVGIVGSRRRDSEEDMDQVEQAFIKVLQDHGLSSRDVAIVSGHCSKGADKFAEIFIDRYDTFGGKDYIYPAAWDDVDSTGPNGEQAVVGINRWGKRYNRHAGHWRNSDIVNRSDIIIACVASDRKGGTEDTVSKALIEGKTVVLV